MVIYAMLKMQFDPLSATAFVLLQKERKTKLGCICMHLLTVLSFRAVIDLINDHLL